VTQFPDQTPGRRVHDPDIAGRRRRLRDLQRVNAVEEMVNMISASRCTRTTLR
jgi:flagellar basal body rod protein FlgC